MTNKGRDRNASQRLRTSVVPACPDFRRAGFRPELSRPSRHADRAVARGRLYRRCVALRSLADTTSKYLGQRIVIDNRPGAAGTIGPTWLAKNGKPDGYVVSQMPITVFRLPHMTKVDF